MKLVNRTQSCSFFFWQRVPLWSLAGYTLRIVVTVYKNRQRDINIYVHLVVSPPSKNIIEMKSCEFKWIVVAVAIRRIDLGWIVYKITSFSSAFITIQAYYGRRIDLKYTTRNGGVQKLRNANRWDTDIVHEAHETETICILGICKMRRIEMTL